MDGDSSTAGHSPSARQEGLTSLSVTACCRCRKQKLRCSRDQPACKRCRSVAAYCEYPQPPDRKLLAARRLYNARPSTYRRAESSRSPHQQQQLSEEAASPIDRSGEADAGHRDRSWTAPEAHQPPTMPLREGLMATTLPSLEVATFLFEIYFLRLYNATLLFHKETFLSDYAANKVPDFVSLSIFALASIFIRPAPGQPQTDAGEDRNELGISLFSAADSNKQGSEWAIAASQRVLIQADVPRLETIQACQNLTLYWFSVSKADRAYMHAHIAYRTAHLLKFHLQNGPSYGMNEPSLLGELQRRCYWSSWITSCISQDITFKADPWKEVAGLLLPSDENSYAAGKPTPSEYFDDSGNMQNSGPIDPQPSISLVAQQRLQVRYTSRLKAALCILQRLKEYWTPLQDLWNSLKLLFASRGLSIDDTARSDKEPNRAFNNEPTDVEKIVSHEGTLKGAGATDIFTYIADPQTKQMLSQPHLETLARAQRDSSQINTSQRGEKMAWRPVGQNNSAQESAIHSALQERPSPVSRSFIVPDPEMRLSFNNIRNTSREFGTAGGGIPGEDMSISDIAEGNQVEAADHSNGQSSAAPNTAGRLADSVMDTNMMDSTDLWWDQSYEASNGDLARMNQMVQLGTSYFGTTFFG
ncbi:hypothetical protein OIDMADRAFT_139648 [Oidiodendron maius Zn]|uniref:Zn(2)-C6 fungal-type domain-containing protein n=1 Tax=Oidiodendron maius (strain Zn) TaxID=913774 RepID=A0A0C3DXI7_OIDMZ|nr:hypothetical protein OIDMADRAFT_139648 [Oidiodendron maius Zn]